MSVTGGGVAAQLEEMIRVDTERFRAEATRAYENFSSEDRVFAEDLASPFTSTQNVFTTWAEQIEPMYRTLDQKRTDTRLKKSLERHFGFHDGDSARAIEMMIEQRKQSLLDEVLDNVYHSDIEERPIQRDRASEFLSQATHIIKDFIERYEQYTTMLSLAESNKVSICDPHAPWLERQRTMIAITKERQRSEEYNQGRLVEIETDISELLDGSDLLEAIIYHNVNTVQLLDFATKYHRRVDELDKSDQKNSTARLKIFEQVTQDFIKDETEKLAHSHHAHTLKTLNKMRNDITELVLEVCELSPTGRNRLLLDIQTHTRLVKERDFINLIQRNQVREDDK